MPGFGAAVRIRLALPICAASGTAEAGLPMVGGHISSTRMPDIRPVLTTARQTIGQPDTGHSRAIQATGPPDTPMTAMQPIGLPATMTVVTPTTTRPGDTHTVAMTAAMLPAGC